MFVGTHQEKHYNEKNILPKTSLYLKQFLVDIANIFMACQHFYEIFSILLDALAHMFLLLHHQCLVQLLQINLFENLLDRSPDLRTAANLTPHRAFFRRGNSHWLHGARLDCKEDDDEVLLNKVCPME